ncbi:MAG TPA: hypothetical protein VHP36_08735 [Chitinispirillaceae bacterium]|nr:hypothetical protein [Chitinispirillaceae bacterium]
MKLFYLISLMITSVYALPSWFPQKANTDYKGYLKVLPYFVFNAGDTNFNNLIHFRADLGWYPWSSFILNIGGRLQLYTGDSFGSAGALDSLANFYSEDVGYADLTDAWPGLLYANIDRAWIGYEYGSLNLMLGRQRINWGTNLVWNPNDWYNAYNFIDFDYEERPGTDALHVQYFTSAVSVAELSLKAGKDQVNRTFAAMYKFNTHGYDLQFQAGLYGLDAAIGFSWSGGISGGGFRGEIAFFQQILDEKSNNFAVGDSSGNFVAAISADYTFSNSLYLHGEFLYNGFGTNGNIDSAKIFLPVTAKNLLPSIFGIFGEVGYTFTPLVYGSISFSTNPVDFSFYLTPAVNWSIFQNIDLYIIAQLFFGEPNSLYGETDDLLALRLRWSF